MGSIDVLRAVVEQGNSDDLAGLLRQARLGVGPTKDERASAVVNALLLGRLEPGALFRGVPEDRLRRMARIAGTPEQGRRARVQEGLERWFRETFDVIPPDDDPDGSGEEDETGYTFSGEEYLRSFSGMMRFDRALAARRPRRYQADAVEALLRVVRRGASPKLLHVATGGGKTWIANDLVVELLRRRGGRVLWVTKDWQLLWQAARDVARRHQGFEQKLRRLGGDGSPIHPLPRWDGSSGAIVYSSLQTFHQRADAFKGDSRPMVVVWDECHWGEHGKLGRHLLGWCSRKGIPVVGLTATPRKPSISEFGEPVYSISFAELIEQGYLARPVPVDPVQTGVDWNPQRNSPHSDFQLDSLRELAVNRARNRLIVQHYIDHQQTYGKAIFFACSIHHADLLARQLCDEGIAARALHSQLPGPENDRALEQLKRGEIKVIVNVAKLTHGVDIPDVRTIFLCRPTLSDILFSQMIGRGSRRDDASGKTSFNIVEFTDNLERFADQLVTSRVFFEGAGGQTVPEVRSRTPASRLPRIRGLTFDPNGAPAEIPENDPLQDIRGLWFRQGQTFGIEFEVTRPGSAPSYDAEWLRIAQQLRAGLASSLGKRVASRVTLRDQDGDKNCELWNVEWDGSCGWEITTRILRDRDGFAEVCLACEVLQRLTGELGLGVNFSTGTHVHLGWMGSDLEELKRAIHLFRLFEPALATLVPPSRVVHFDGEHYDPTRPNRYCAPVSTIFPNEVLNKARTIDELMAIAGEEGNRYVTFNIVPFERYHTVEVRLHGGTLEAGKILLWVSLMMQLLWAASRPVNIPPTVDRSVLYPDEDILRLAREFLPARQLPEMLQRLEARRKEIVSRWRSIQDLRGWAIMSGYRGW